VKASGNPASSAVIVRSEKASRVARSEANGHAEPIPRAWDARLAAIERRLADIAGSGEHRIAILRDAIGDFYAGELAKRDDDIAILKKHIADLEHKLAQKTLVDRQVAEVAAQLEERQARRDEAKRGPQGRQGPKGERGERGARGRNGVTKVVKQTVKIRKWLVDTKTFTVTAVLADGTPMAVLNLYPLFEKYDDEVARRSS
jgi:hypothetical protein